MGWIGFVRCHKFRVSCSNETLPNAPKHYETHQNWGLGSNWVDRVRSLRKIPMRLHATNLCIKSTISAPFTSSSCSNGTIQNAPKHYETHQNKSLESNGLDRVDWVRLLRKILMRLHGTNLCINCTSSTHFAPSFV